MRLVVTERCNGHGRCYSAAPHLIDEDEFGHAAVFGDGRVPDGQLKLAEAIVAGCPEGALELLNDE